MAQRKLEVLITAKEIASQAFKKVKSQITDMDEKMKQNLKTAQKWGVGVASAIAGFGVVAVSKAAELETMTIAFESMLGSGEAAKEMMEGLTDFTASTPFQLQGVTTAARQLLAAGTAAEDIQDQLRYLGDIAAGANVPLEDMSGIMAKIQNKGKAMTEEILQLSDRGVPVIDVLANQFGVAKEQVFEMAEKGEISFEIMEEAMRSMSAEGGIFEDQMEKQSKTIAGLWSTLKDNVSLALGELGTEIVEVLDLRAVMARTIEAIQGAVDWFQNLSPQMKKVLVIGAGVVAAIGLLTAALATIALAAGPVLTALGAVGGAMAVLAGPIGWAIAAVGLLATAWATNFGGIRDITKGVISDIVGFFTEMKDLALGVINDMLESMGLDWNDLILGARVAFELLKGVVTFVMEVIGATVKRIFSNIRVVIQTVLNTIAGIIKVVTGVIKGDWSLVWEGVKQIFKAAIDFVVGIARNWAAFFAELFGTTLGDVKQKFIDVKEKVSATVSAMMDFMKAKLQAGRDKVVGIINSIKDKFTSGMDETKSVWSNAWTLIKNIGKLAFDAYTSILKAQWELIKNLFKGALDFVLGLFGSSWDEMANLLRDAKDRMIATISELWGTITGFVSDIGDKLNQVASDAYQWGKNMVLEFANGVKDFAMAPINAAKDMMAGVKDFIGFQSPTKKGPGSDADKWAPNLVNMFADGIKATAPAVYKNADEMVAKIRERFGDDGELMAMMEEWEGDEVLGEKFAEIAAQVEAKLQEIETSFEGAKTSYGDLAQSAGESLSEMKADHETKINDMKEKIGDLKGELNALQDAYNLDIQGVDTSIGEKVIEQEELIKSLREEMANASEGADISGLQAQLAAEQSALQEFLSTATGLEDEIAEARRRASLTDFERFIEDQEAKKEALTAEFDLKKALLEEEMAAVELQKAAEIAAFEEKIAEYQKVQAEFLKLKGVFEGGLASMASAAELQVARINESISALEQALQKLNETSVPTINDIEISSTGASIPGFANGGVVTEPTLAMVGEGAYSEAVVPLPDGRSIPVQMNGGGSNVTVKIEMGGVTISNNVDKEAFFREMETRLARAVQLKRSGSQA